MKKLLPIFLLVLFFSFKIPSALAISEAECAPDGINDARSSRPAPCNLCCPRTETITTSCATTFTLYKNISFPKNTSQEKIPWEARFNVDVSGTSLPFAGKAGEEDEINYLADYFEGTNEYYYNYGNQTTLTNYQGILRKLTPFEYQNQLKKQLIARAPASADEDKENRIHNYQVKYVGRLCWNTPFWMDAGRFVFNEILDLTLNSVGNTVVHILKDIFIDRPVALIDNIFKTKIADRIAETGEDIRVDLELPNIGHYCLYEDIDSSGAIGYLIVKGFNFFHRIKGLGQIQDFLVKASKIPGLVHLDRYSSAQESLTAFRDHLPPSPNEENYAENYLAWKKSGPKDDKEEGYWYRLWQVVPLVSREDTPGEVKPYIGKSPDVILTVDNEDNRLEKIPHLARLFESSQIINQVLVPKTNEEIEKKVSEDFPETNPPAECFKENYLIGEGDNLCCGNIPGSVKGQFENPYFNECAGKIATSSADRCYGVATENIIQGVGVKLSHPYLDEIWHNTTYSLLGFFNIFRPHQITAFEDIDVASTISYSSSGSEVSPQEGFFFYPHLGGVQKAKEWVVNQVLWPYKE